MTQSLTLRQERQSETDEAEKLSNVETMSTTSGSTLPERFASKASQNTPVVCLKPATSENILPEHLKSTTAENYLPECVTCTSENVPSERLTSRMRMLRRLKLEKNAANNEKQGSFDDARSIPDKGMKNN